MSAAGGRSLNVRAKLEISAGVAACRAIHPSITCSGFIPAGESHMVLELRRARGRPELRPYCTYCLHQLAIVAVTLDARKVRT